MNEHNENRDFAPEPDEDPMLDEVLSGLKRLEPPLESRIANRMAIAAELSSLNLAKNQDALPWWRRSISVPVPVAASLIVLAALALPSSFRGWQVRSSVEVDAPRQSVDGEPKSPLENPLLAERSHAADRVLTYYESETYLCGVGRVNSETRYLIKE